MATTETPQVTENPAPEQPHKVDWIAEIRGLALMLLAVLAFHSLVAKPFYIPSTSMMPPLPAWMRPCPHCARCWDRWRR